MSKLGLNVFCMKKIICTIIIMSLLFVSGCKMSEKNESITPEEAEKLCYLVLGEKDEETGFPFSFSATSTLERNGIQYHVIRATWLVNNDHMSYIGDFFVSSDGKEIYSGFIEGDKYSLGNLIWSK